MYIQIHTSLKIIERLILPPAPTAPCTAPMPQPAPITLSAHVTPKGLIPPTAPVPPVPPTASMTSQAPGTPAAVACNSHGSRPVTPPPRSAPFFSIAPMSDIHSP